MFRLGIVVGLDARGGGTVGSTCLLISPLILTTITKDRKTDILWNSLLLRQFLTSCIFLFQASWTVSPGRWVYRVLGSGALLSFELDAWGTVSDPVDWDWADSSLLR